MAAMMGKRKRIVFLAAHLLSPLLASGGDVLFAEIAVRLRALRPDWEILAVAPDFTAEGLERYVERVVPLRTGRGEGAQGSALRTALTWAKRVPTTANILTGIDADLVHTTGDFFIDVAPVVALRQRRRCAWSGVVHHINAPPAQRKNDAVVAAASYALQRGSFAALRSADAISVLNHEVRTDLTTLRFSAERLHVVGAGIDVRRFPLLPVADRAKRVVWLNRLEPTKGLFDLPEIVRRLPEDAVLDVIGRGPEVHVARLRQALEEAGVVGRCVLHGFLSEEKMREVMRRASVFISCSYEEGWGISIAEALAMGLPCVTYDLPSHREIFGTSIARAPLGKTEMFAELILSALDRPESDDDRRARRAIAERFSLDACARRQERVFASLLGEARNGYEEKAISLC